MVAYVNSVWFACVFFDRGCVLLVLSVGLCCS